jgi:hypothetical protein
MSGPENGTSTRPATQQAEPSNRETLTDTGVDHGREAHGWHGDDGAGEVCDECLDNQRAKKSTVASKTTDPRLSSELWVDAFQW